mmetsp:Transcript_15015/g.45441  ORF Transcript_15015/g.45441 Transcript_15015/m.45441 type:complete len:352 (+) Transcript_15015:397-1452(+)
MAGVELRRFCGGGVDSRHGATRVVVVSVEGAHGVGEVGLEVGVGSHGLVPPVAGALFEVAQLVVGGVAFLVEVVDLAAQRVDGELGVGGGRCGVGALRVQLLLEDGRVLQGQQQLVRHALELRNRLRGLVLLGGGRGGGRALLLLLLRRRRRGFGRDDVVFLVGVVLERPLAAARRQRGEGLAMGVGRDAGRHALVDDVADLEVRSLARGVAVDESGEPDRSTTVLAAAQTETLERFVAHALDGGRQHGLALVLQYLQPSTQRHVLSEVQRRAEPVVARERREPRNELLRRLHLLLGEFEGVERARTGQQRPSPPPFQFDPNDVPDIRVSPNATATAGFPRRRRRQGYRYH